MSQARLKQESPLRDVRRHWFERGYRPELAALQPAPNEDPRGEQAYQRAFAEAAKADPPRLPNPQWYPNSPSAQDYMRKRNVDFLLPRGSKRPGNELMDAQQDVRKQRDPDRSPSLPAAKQNGETNSMASFGTNTGLPGPPSASVPRIADNLVTSPLPLNTPSQQPFLAPRLTVLEPYCGPSGPVNKLR